MDSSFPNRENYKNYPEFASKLDKYLAAHFKIENIPERPRLERNEFKQIHEILSEVLTTISQVHANLLPDLIGDSSHSGVPGKAADREQSNELIKRDNVQYVNTGNSNGLEIYPRGAGKVKKKNRKKRIKAKTGKGQDEGVQGDGRYSVEVKEVPEEEEEEEELIQTYFDIIDAHREGKPTVFFEKTQDEPLTLVINSFRPASSVARIAKGKYRRDILADKIIRAAYRFTYKGNDLNEFENMVEETWNAMYKL
jgi:hypothetical protein